MVNTLLTIINNFNFSIFGESFPKIYEGEPDSLGPIIDGLIPSVPVIIGTVISLLIVFWVISYFIYFPVKKIVEERSKKIKNDLLTAEKLNSQASKSLKKAQDAVNSSKKEAVQIIEKSIIEAKDVKSEIVDQAKQKADVILKEVRTQIIHEKHEAKEEINDEIVSVAMLAAKKIITKELDSSTNQKLINDLIKELGKQNE